MNTNEALHWAKHGGACPDCGSTDIERRDNSARCNACGAQADFKPLPPAPE